MALSLPLPRRILTHAHWTLGRQKMAKSTGNVVNPFFALERFGVDTMRYYLAHDGGISDDADYGNEYIIERYKKGPQGALGNLASRVMRGKKWSVRGAIERSRLELMERELEEADKEQRELVAGLRFRVEKEFDELNPGAALKIMMDVIYQVSSCHH